MRADLVVVRSGALDFAGLTERIERVYHDGRLVCLQSDPPHRHDNSAGSSSRVV